MFTVQTKSYVDSRQTQELSFAPYPYMPSMYLFQNFVLSSQIWTNRPEHCFAWRTTFKKKPWPVLHVLSCKSVNHITCPQQLPHPKARKMLLGMSTGDEDTACIVRSVLFIRHKRFLHENLLMFPYFSQLLAYSIYNSIFHELLKSLIFRVFLWET